MRAATAAIVVLLLPLWLAVPLAVSAAESEWIPAGPEAPLLGAPSVRETRWTLERPPGGASDRIQVHRYRGAGASEAVLLYLPGTNMNGQAAIARERHNLWLYLAARGIETWALDYRTHFVLPEPAPHAFMQHWTLELFVADALEAAALARRESGHARVFVAGFSRGATLAFAFACVEAPQRLAGLVVLDGSFKAATPDGIDFEAERAALLAAGRYASDVAEGFGWEERQRLMAAVMSDPKGPATAPGFASVGEQLAQVLYTAWSPGALADPVSGVSRVQVLAELLYGYDRYYPKIQNLEGRSIASLADDPRTAIDDAWGEFSLPVLYFGASGMGADWILDGVHSAVKSGSGDVSLHLLEGYGHLDLLVAERAREEVYEPIRRWIRARSR